MEQYPSPEDLKEKIILKGKGSVFEAIIETFNIEELMSNLKVSTNSNLKYIKTLKENLEKKHHGWYIFYISLKHIFYFLKY